MRSSSILGYRAGTREALLWPEARARGRKSRSCTVPMRAIRVLSYIFLLLCPLMLNAKAVVRRAHYRVVRRARTHHRVRRLVYFSPIKGSRESLLRQNVRLDEDNLERIQDDDQLQQMVQSNQLVALPETRSASVSDSLPEERRYCRPWTAEFVQDFADKFYAVFHRPLEVTSAVRTVEVQRHLLRVNGNAAAESGELASPHLSGATVDISKKGLTRKELTWSRQQLLKMQQAGLLDVEEEFHQAVFHITVYKDYQVATSAPAIPAAAQQSAVAQ